MLVNGTWVLADAAGIGSAMWLIMMELVRVHPTWNFNLVSYESEQHANSIWNTVCSNAMRTTLRMHE